MHHPPHHAGSVHHLARIGDASGEFFGDGTALQMASVTGNAAKGHTAGPLVGVSF
ncbi:hypothetical protein [Massilia sp. UYP11]|uniref:hypothetical protein n=1 Tax=Massilia sp. UYP11 TaxID=1756385 RepID=UPI003D1D4B3B